MQIPRTHMNKSRHISVNTYVLVSILGDVKWKQSPQELAGQLVWHTKETIHRYPSHKGSIGGLLTKVILSFQLHVQKVPVECAYMNACTHMLCIQVHAHVCMHTRKENF